MKKKGNRKDNNTYRGITLLSAGSNLLARAVATRLGCWSEGFIHESHCDFRKGRGVDDSLEISRTIVEEVVKTTSEAWVLLSFFDIEKAYPRVCKDALWELIGGRWCPPGLLRILKALHEVRMQ